MIIQETPTWSESPRK